MDHGLSDVVTLECRDVCKDGFGLKDRADAGDKVICVKIITHIMNRDGH